MKNLRTIVFSFLLCAITSGMSMAQTISIDLENVANSTFVSSGAINSGDFPTGSMTFNGVNFFINDSGDNLWHSDTAANSGSGTVYVDIPINLQDVQTVYTLISTFWGEKTDGTFVSIEFFGSGNAYHQVDLDGGVHIRDYNYNPSFTTTLNPQYTKEVWNNGSQKQHLDMQTFVLPDSFKNQTLENIRLTDSGDYEFQRSFIAALSVLQGNWQTACGDYQTGFNDGKKYCIDNPSACGISAGSSTGTVTINPDLSFSIPNASYKTLLGSMDLEVDFTFFGEQSGKLLWELESYKVK